MTGSPPSSSMEARDETPPADQRVSALVGDRLCIKCGYNLTGQPVVREAHYAMLIVRCPECGTVASVHEYPLLGRWAGRWAALLAGLWVLFLLGCLAATTAVLYGFSYASSDEASYEYAHFLATKQQAWAKQQVAAMPPPATQPANAAAMRWARPTSPEYLAEQPAHPHVMADPTWWSQQNPVETLQQAGGWWKAIDWSACGNWIALSLTVFPLGCVWSIFLLHFRRSRLVFFAMLPLGLAAAFLLMSSNSSGGFSGFRFGWPWGATMNVHASRQIGLWFGWLTLGFACIPLLAGLLLGRSLARGLIRLLLPPRLRSSLALLWIADGRIPPSTRKAAN